MIKVVTPDIGAEHAEVIEVLVKKGDHISVEDSIITIESEKSSIEVPSSHTGVVNEVIVKIGDKISKNQVILHLEGIENKSEKIIETVEEKKQTENIEKVKTVRKVEKSEKKEKPEKSNTYDFDVCIIGGGPGGYTAAFRSADLGLKVMLIERYKEIGGVCLNVGCIPSKTLLHGAHVIEEAQRSSESGITFAKPNIDLKKLLAYKLSIIKELNTGLSKIADLRNVVIKQGTAEFHDEHTVKITLPSNKTEKVSFNSAIIAVGSKVVQLPFIPKHENIWDSTDALELRKIPKTMMILGGGIIGLEMATVYSALGSKITIVELGSQLIPEADKDSVLPLMKKIKGEYDNIWLNTKATAFKLNDKGIEVTLEGSKAPKKQVFEVVLTAVGRSPNGKTISAEKAGVKVSEQGFIEVDLQQKTNIDHIYAIGDVVGQPMLAHKATHQAKVAAETIHGDKVSFSPMTIPSVAYTHPEIAWMGKTEKQIKADNIDYKKGVFPWQASGRALSSGGRSGYSKVLFCPKSNRLLGASITGPNAGELISEAVLALEMGATAQDLALTIHPHPTLSETFAMAAEVVDGSITDIPQSKR